MLDLRFVRENPEIVKQNIRNKFQDNKLPLVDEVIALDEESRKVKKEADDLRANRNKISKQIGMLMGQGKKEEAEESRAQEQHPLLYRHAGTGGKAPHHHGAHGIIAQQAALFLQIAAQHRNIL